jgi:hypothetical protein
VEFLDDHWVSGGLRHAGRFPWALWFLTHSQHFPLLSHVCEVQAQVARFASMLGQETLMYFTYWNYLNAEIVKKVSNNRIILYELETWATSAGG